MKTPVGGTPNPDTTPPTVTMTAPAQGTFVGASVNVAATATDTVGVQSVQFLLDGSPLGLPDTAAPFGVTWTTAGASAGLHTLAARATDAAGNQATSTGISVVIDRTPPSVAITAPAGGATVSSIVTLSANASDNAGVQSVQFRIDGCGTRRSVTRGPHTASPGTPTRLANGTHFITAVVRDKAGNRTTSATVTVTVSNTQTQPTGLVAAYGFNEWSGTRAGAVSRATLTRGQYRSARNSDAMNNGVTVLDAPSLDLTTALTLRGMVPTHSRERLHPRSRVRDWWLGRHRACGRVTVRCPPRPLLASGGQGAARSPAWPSS